MPSTSSIPDCVPSLCTDPRCPAAVLRAATADEVLFYGGAYTDADGRLTAQRLIQRGYPETVVLRMEARRD